MLVAVDAAAVNKNVGKEWFQLISNGRHYVLTTTYYSFTYSIYYPVVYVMEQSKADGWKGGGQVW